ncbi:MAG: hypothetical protein ACFFE8_05565 [Candidatus Heimdallarchaeota archaeon]
MTSLVQFSWSRLDGIGLILAVFGLTLAAQIPLSLFALLILNFEFSTHVIAMTGSILGGSIVMTTIICTISEDWWIQPSPTPPTLQRVLSLTLLFIFLFFGGFLVFFFMEPFFPPEISEISPFQRFFSAYLFALTLIGILIIVVNRIRRFFI